MLNSNFKTIETLEGDVIDGSLTIDANSDIRTTCDMTIVIKDSSYNVSENSKIWLDKYIRVKIGIFHFRKNDYIWYNKGIFILTNAGYKFNASTSTLSISLIDLVGKLNGIRGGQISGTEILVPVDSDIRSAMISTLTQLGSFQKYIIEDIGELVPYDLKFSTGAYVYNIISELRDLYPAWETYFDEDGIFICKPIPTTKEDDIVLDDSIIKPLIIDESINFDFSEVKNSIEIWGVNTDEGQMTATVTDTNPESPFSIEKIGEIKDVLSGSPYDKIPNNDLCRQRAEYELWQKTRLNDKLTLETIPVYWLGVNQKFRYTPINENESKEYIIKSLSIPLGIGTMTINAIRFYPLYPNIINPRELIKRIVYNHETLQDALNDKSVDIIAFANDITLNDSLSVPTNRKVEIISNMDEPAYLYSAENARHFSVYESKKITLTFNSIIIDGQSISGGMDFINTSLNLDGAKIQNCNAVIAAIDNFHGGGIYCKRYYRENERKLTLSVTNSTISNNVGQDGGGVYCNDYDGVTISNCSINNNTANGILGDGGGIYYSNWNKGGDDGLIIDSCNVNNNVASRSGGGIYYIRSQRNYMPLIISNSFINNNVCNSNGIGGGIFCEHSAIITNSSISGNIIKSRTKLYCYGGGIGYYGLLTITDSIVSDNIIEDATGEGGGIYYDITSRFSTQKYLYQTGLIASNVKITNNFAGGIGGGIYFNVDNTDTTSEDNPMKRLQFKDNVEFSNNKTNIPYWIEKDNDDYNFLKYGDMTASELKQIYNDYYKKYVTSLSAPPIGEAPFGYMFNNYDVSYIGSDEAKTSK